MSKLPYPWLDSAWMRLMERRAVLPHALLVRGRSGIGKTNLARTFARALLCERPSSDGFACERCAACDWFAQGNHPDFRQVEPEILSASQPSEEALTGKTESLSKQIRIDQIRDLQSFLAVGSHRGGLRIVLIRPAEAMNAATANALLKSLEEPGPRTLFMLVSSNAQRLLPTVRSRCQAVEVAIDGREPVIAWLGQQAVRDPVGELAYAGASPLDVVEQAGTVDARERLVAELSRRPFAPLAAADRCATMEPAAFIDGLQKWVFDLARISCGVPARYFPRHEGTLRELSTATDQRALLGLGRALARARAVAQHPLNARLYMEDLFIRYAATRGSTHA
jgi:DNA polymerase-3 subunit delta'